MTDSFIHPDGHHYRFLGFRPYRRGDYWLDEFTMVYTDIDGESHHPHFIFERVEPPLWPWTGPSGNEYRVSTVGSLYIVDFEGDFAEVIPKRDFAGLGERLKKQAELNEGDA